MATKAINPATWIASWSEDGTTISFPIASIPDLTAAQADGTTGDIREVVKLLLEQLYTYQESVAQEAKIEHLVIGKTHVSPAAGKLRTQYAVVLETDVVETSVETEATY